MIRHCSFVFNSTSPSIRPSRIPCSNSPLIRPSHVRRSISPLIQPSRVPRSNLFSIQPSCALHPSLLLLIVSFALAFFSLSQILEISFLAQLPIRFFFCFIFQTVSIIAFDSSSLSRANQTILLSIDFNTQFELSSQATSAL